MILRKIRHVLERKGLTGLLDKASRALRKTICQRRCYVVARRPLDIPMIKFRKLLEVTFCQIHPADIHRIDYIPESRKRRLWTGYFKNGDLCFGGLHDNKPVFHVFATFKPFRDTAINFTVPVQPNQVYQFEGVANREFRGKGVAVTIMEPFWKLMQQHGKTETVAMFDLDNRAACKFHKRLSFEPFLLVKSTIILRRFPITSSRPWNPDTDVINTAPIKDGNTDTL